MIRNDDDKSQLQTPFHLHREMVAMERNENEKINKGTRSTFHNAELLHNCTLNLSILSPASILTCFVHYPQSCLVLHKVLYPGLHPAANVLYFSNQPENISHPESSETNGWKLRKHKLYTRGNYGCLRKGLNLYIVISVWIQLSFDNGGICTGILMVFQLYTRSRCSSVSFQWANKTMSRMNVGREPRTLLMER